jgi:hypothetical protein
MIESHSSPEIKTASLLHRFHKKKERKEQIEKRLSETSRAWDQRFYDTLTKRLQVVTAMKEVLYSEIIKYSPQR